MAIPNLKYQVSGAGFPVAQPISQILSAGTIVDTSQAQWAWLASVPPPVDAIALTQQTFDYMTSSNGVVGLYLDVNRVRVGFGVVSTALDQGSDYWSRPSHKPPQGAA
jgi:hypothetical protein